MKRKILIIEKKIITLKNKINENDDDKLDLEEINNLNNEIDYDEEDNILFNSLENLFN